MSVPSTPFYITQKTQDSLIDFCKQTVTASYGINNLRTRFEYIDREYIRENRMVSQDMKTQAANAAGNKRLIADAVIPIVEPQVETAHSYLTSVFLTGVPMFGVVGNKANSVQARSLEAVITNNQYYGGWTREFSLFFRDALKYNFSAVEVSWCTEKIWSLETNTQFSTKEGKPKEKIWAGNKIKRLPPYNIMFDPRVPITQQYKSAEFCGYTELYNRIMLIDYMQKLPFRMNYTKALESSGMSESIGGSTGLFYIPSVFDANTSYNKLAGAMDWSAWAFGRKGTLANMKNLYVLATRYIRLIPMEFEMNVPLRNQVQIWKVVTVNDNIVIYVERMTNAHGYIPIFFGQPIEDGLDLQTKSFAQKQIPFQDLASSLANSKLAARRRLIADRMLYDPLRIRSEDINSDSPVAKIPVRPGAYGQPLEKAVFHIPFRDEQTGTLMQDVREIKGYSDYVSGQNPAQQGQFVKGNKTRSEYDDVQNKSSGRQQDMAILIEGQTMAPTKEVLLKNTLQYQQADEVYNPGDKQTYEIDPAAMRNVTYMFKVSDGLIPADKLMDGDTLKVAFQAVASSPQLSAEYNVGDIFAHLMRIGGVDIDDYKYTDVQKQQMQQNEIEKIKAEGAAKQGIPVQGATINANPAG